ncbi:MAG: hypothetical protein WBF06_01970 [Candidatus Acidiferrales bacterium]
MDAKTVSIRVFAQVLDDRSSRFNAPEDFPPASAAGCDEEPPSAKIIFQFKPIFLALKLRKCLPHNSTSIRANLWRPEGLHPRLYLCSRPFEIISTAFIIVPPSHPVFIAVK